ncbi:unnamed protein product, partial [marine sediment metagenome]
PMGSEYLAAAAPILSVDAVGTAAIARAEIKKNGKVVHVETPGKDTLRMDWRDPEFQADRPSYYYVRIVQVDNEEAICSPIWAS